MDYKILPPAPRLAAVITAAAFVAVILCGCNFIAAQREGTNHAAASPQITANPGGGTENPSGNQATESTRPRGSVEDELYYAILNRKAECDLSAYKIPDYEFSEKYNPYKINDDHPEIGYLSQYKWNSINGIITVISLEYKKIPADYDTQLNKAVEAAIQSILSKLQDDFQQDELVCVISDYIAVNCRYAYEADGVTPDNEYSLAYSALVQHKAICEGYAAAFSLLAQRFGLEVKKVSGTAEPGNSSHAWNLVKIYGKWYHVDTTWNDPSPDSEGQATHNYLLLSDNAVASRRNGSSRYHAAWNADAPPATDTRYENAFWIYENKPISFAQLHYDEWDESIANTSFESIISYAVENGTEANIARFRLSVEELAAEIWKLYPSVGYSYTYDSDGIVVAVGDWMM